MKRVAVYPGSFDPMTNGHMEILRRALSVFDEVIILVAVSPTKKSLFSLGERFAMIKEATKELPGVSVDMTEGLSINYAREHGAIALVRGLRAATDFEYEFKMAAGNRFVDPKIDMVFFMSAPAFTFLSSSTIKELFMHGTDISPLVPLAVAEALKKKLNEIKK
ncbi:MAG: pantetheine-phosphate adenylyltransferase [Bacilli bacterium]|jgi:pantetheine-phosphate adenylyltransferase|nr:pantetheine-phosphate adenylyltransferase [Bacilli bacterium]MCH4201706.1 pantetheine-phosphate adenylyltransferase [Bacilli bacterium]MCH4235894.1 pantetheine-phosphate adenylyltransferase [Bacilli bacterium]